MINDAGIGQDRINKIPGYTARYSNFEEAGNKAALFAAAPE